MRLCSKTEPETETMLELTDARCCSISRLPRESTKEQNSWAMTLSKRYSEVSMNKLQTEITELVNSFN
jgi:hypothetical protein